MSNNPNETLPAGHLDFQAMEQRILDFWASNRCFEKLREKNAAGPLFRFLDGPITANNPMGVHHAWGRTLKDAFLRYKAMHGFCANWQNGFDSQGLWVEVEVERELGFQSKRDIQAFGVDNFVRACKERVKHYSSVITEQSIRLGQWMDWDNSYFTHTDLNIEGIWHFLKKCHESGWIYQSHRPLAWCPRCGTSLSEHEMAGSHQDVVHKAVYVALPVHGLTGRILVWTTTPWTLPGNVALAVNPGLTYCEVEVPAWPTPLIVGKAVVEQIFGPGHSITRELPGTELVGLEYETFLPALDEQQKIPHPIIAWDKVEATEGTGVVHIAPGAGPEDFDLARMAGLPILATVDESGNFLPGFDPYSGTSTSDALEPILHDLGAQGKLFRAHDYEHSYPVCWRCKTETIFRLVDEWFISSEEVRPRMLAAVKNVTWQPEHIRRLMEDWLRNMGDWNISRKRFYGLPLPFYPCSQCGKVTVVGSKAELREMGGEGVDALPELHRPWIDEITIRCPECGNEVKRIPEVGDVWLDAGIVPYSTLGYFDDKDRWQKSYPAEWIVEMREQVRLWFYSMLFMGVTLHDRAPYEHVTAHESVVSEEGNRFSKTGYMIKFEDAAGNMGADVMRYLFAAAPLSNNVRFGYSLGTDVRKRLLTLQNVCSFFQTYARLDMPNLTDTQAIGQIPLIDSWLLERTAAFGRDAASSYDAYETQRVVREFESFLEDLSNWYVRINRRRFWKNDDLNDKRSAYRCLFHALTSACQVMAPIIPFLTEEIWQTTVLPFDATRPISVHLSEWPRSLPGAEGESLIADVALARTIINAGLRLRAKSQMKVRQPLPALYVATAKAEQDTVERWRRVIADELNVKDVTVIDDPNTLRRPRLQLDLRTAGPALKEEGPRVRSILDSLGDNEMKQAVARVEAHQDVELPSVDRPLPATLFTIDHGEMKEGFIADTDGGLTVVLDTRVTPALMVEGLARDIVRHAQILRKDVQLNVDQRIVLGIESAAEPVRMALADHGAYIAAETLAVRVEPQTLAEAHTRDVKIGDAKVRISLTPTDSAASGA
jgi:isoleucyl-tRNA synthetase